MNLYNIRRSLSSGENLNSVSLRVTYYSRVSTDHEEQMNSLNNQINYFEEMIKSNKNWTYVSGYVDAGISGTTDYKRCEFMHMIDDALLDKFDLIITKEISRFSRNTLDSIKYTRILLDAGVGVYFLNDNINTILPDSELRLTIMASMAQDEVRRLSERVKFGMQRSIKKGIILGNNLLYGYEKVNNQLIINNDESVVVKRLFTMYAIEKLSLNKIAKIFNEEKIKTSLNRKWNVTTLSRMISNPKYKGFYCGRKSEVIDYMSKRIKYLSESDWVMYENYDNIPPIVDEVLFNLANERLKKNKKKFCDKYTKYALSNKIKCACGTYFYRRKMSKKKCEYVWFCHNCKLSIRESEIFYIISDIFKLDLNIINDLLNKLYNKYYFGNGIYNYDEELKRIDEKKDKLLELLMNDYISNQEFKNKISKYNEEIEKINMKLKELGNEENYKVEKYVNNYLESYSFSQELIKNFISEIMASSIDKDNIKLSIKSDVLDKMRKNYKFKRGFDVIGTRRYIFNVILYIN